jgi:hypothetical protein
MFKVVSQARNVVNLIQFRSITGVPLLTVRLNGAGMLAYRNNLPAAGPQVNSTVLVSRGRWHTLETRLLVAGSAGQIQVWYDGTPVSALSRTESFGSAPVGRLQLGDQRVGPIYNLLFDGVLVSTDFTP